MLERFSRKKEKSGLPLMKAEDILVLPEDEFNEAASGAGVSPEKFREILRRTQSEKDARASQAQNEVAMVPEESESKVHQAFMSIVGDFDFLSKEWSAQKIQKLREDADASVRTFQRHYGDNVTFPESIKRKYAEVFLGEAMMHVAPLLSNSTVEYVCESAIVYLKSRIDMINLYVERHGATRAISLFEARIRDAAHFEELLGLYRAQKDGSEMTYEQKALLARILGRARTAAMTERFSIQEKSHTFDALIPALAEAIRDAGVYRNAIDGTSGSVEVFDMPGDRGTGGKMSYRKGPRPHRDDYGSYGDND